MPTMYGANAAEQSQELERLVDDAEFACKPQQNLSYKDMHASDTRSGYKSRCTVIFQAAEATGRGPVGISLIDFGSR